VVVALLIAASPAFGVDPGTVAVVGGDLAELCIPVVPGAEWTLQYDPAKISVWDSPSKTTLLVPDAPVAGPPMFGDFDADGDVDKADLLDFMVRFTGPGPGGGSPPYDAADADTDGDVDYDDHAVFAANLTDPGGFPSPPPPPANTEIYVEGLVASAALADATITILVDPDRDGVFTVQGTEDVTVVSLDVTPTTGGLGTPLTITLQPAIAPLAIDATTTAVWTGRFETIAGPQTPEFVVDYDAAQVRESSINLAVLVIGDGTVRPPCPAPPAVGSGSLIGSLELQLSAGVVHKDLSITLDAEGDFHQLDYPEDESGLLPGAPVLGARFTQLVIAEINQDHPDEMALETPNAFHSAFVLKIDENTHSSQDAPAQLIVTMESRDLSGVTIDSIFSITLSPIEPDGDPDNLTYSSDVLRPIVFVDSIVNKSMYPGINILRAVEGGSIISLPCN
jgi:hypothetical protein